MADWPVAFPGNPMLLQNVYGGFQPRAFGGLCRKCVLFSDVHQTKIASAQVLTLLGKLRSRLHSTSSHTILCIHGALKGTAGASALAAYAP